MLFRAKLPSAEVKGTTFSINMLLLGKKVIPLSQNMKTELILVGRTADKHFQAGISDYAARISHYMPFNINVIPELRNTKNLTEEQQKQAEGELILKLLQP